MRRIAEEHATASAEEVKVTSEESQSEPTKYPLNELLEHSGALFNCAREVVVGALHDSKEQEYTVDEVKALIDKFLSKEVK